MVCGGKGDDVLSGSKGNHVLACGAGHKRLDDGAGYDTARFDQNYADSTISTRDGVTTVSWDGGSSELKHIENMQFVDKSLPPPPEPDPSSYKGAGW